MNTSPDRNSTLKTAGLGAALAFLATEAGAAIVYNDVEDKTANGSPCTAQVSASFDPISGETFACYGSAMYAIGLTNCAGNTTFSFGNNPGTITSISVVSAPVSAGSLIDSSLAWTDFDSTGQSTPADFTGYALNEPALVAYRFTTDSETYLYGWAEFSTDYASSIQYVGLYAFAYEDSGAGILAGSTSSIPEPGVTAAIFGLVAVALIGFRRLRAIRA